MDYRQSLIHNTNQFLAMTIYAFLDYVELAVSEIMRYAHHSAK